MSFGPHLHRRVLIWRLFLLPLAATVAVAQGTPQGRYAASLVDESSYRLFIDERMYTHLGMDRGFGPHHDLARNNIEAAFNGYGLQTTLHAFTYQSGTYYNVVAELPGTTRPTEIYIIGGHYDSVGNPGADDNASGVTGVVEIARLISQWESEATIRFIAFDREEQGLIGSTAYATAHAGENIRGMISMDMIAFRGSAPNYPASVVGREQSLPLKQALAAALTEYAGVTVTIEGRGDYSDHAPFEWLGFQATCLIEKEFRSNPHYHRATDSVDTPNYIDYTFATKMTAGVMGWLVDAAGVTPDLPRGDMNGSYTVDNFDVDPFVLALLDREAYRVRYPHINPDETGDINRDGVLDNFDIDPFVELLVGP